MARLVLPKTLSLMCVVVSLLTCNGCVGIVVAAATMGSVVVLKGETLSAMERDHRITATLSRHWRKNKLPHSQLVIETYHGVVLLVGHVSTQAYTQPLVHFAHQVPGVRRVYHEIARAPALSVGRRSKDAWITTKVKSHFVAQKSISATAIKVTTYNGIVYLMGIVTPYEGKQASNQARTVQGVKRVVTLFQYRPAQ